MCNLSSHSGADVEICLLGHHTVNSGRQEKLAHRIWRTVQEDYPGDRKSKLLWNMYTYLPIHETSYFSQY